MPGLGDPWRSSAFMDYHASQCYARHSGVTSGENLFLWGDRNVPPPLFIRAHLRNLRFFYFSLLCSLRSFAAIFPLSPSVLSVCSVVNSFFSFFSRKERKGRKDVKIYGFHDLSGLSSPLCLFKKFWNSLFQDWSIECRRRLAGLGWRYQEAGLKSSQT